MNRDGTAVVTHAGVEEFARLARPLLEADPVRHTIALSGLDRLCRGAGRAAVLLTLHDGGRLVGAAERTVGCPLVLSAVPPALVADVDAVVATVDPEVGGANGPVAVVEAFAAAYTARTGTPTRVVMRQRLFRLGTLTPPVGVPGAARPAAEPDVDLLAEWQRAFVQEALPALHPPPARPDEMRNAVAQGGLTLWEVGGRPVAYAVARPPVSGMSRIGPVYTPSEHRCRGYGAAVTAAAARWAVDQGVAHVALFTDLTNPTTNRIYPRLGFRPVHDTREIRFGAPREPAGP